MAREVLAPRLITSLVYLRYFFPNTVRLKHKDKIRIEFLILVTYTDYATYISVLIIFTIGSGCCLRLVMLGLYDFDSLLLFGVTLGQRDLLLRHNYITLTVRSLVVIGCCCTASLLLLFNLSGRAHRVEVVSDESIGELVPCNRHCQ